MFLKYWEKIHFFYSKYFHKLWNVSLSPYLLQCEHINQLMPSYRFCSSSCTNSHVMLVLYTVNLFPIIQITVCLVALVNTSLIWHVKISLPNLSPTMCSVLKKTYDSEFSHTALFVMSKQNFLTSQVLLLRYSDT